ncbi:MAG: phage baseplate assembly protein V [Acidobacteriota bacterium]
MTSNTSSSTDAARQGFYGKYRGTVTNNIDPMQIGRIQAIVPDVTSLLPGSWAMPCVPVAGINNGMFVLPLIGSGVWIEFERGDPDFPIWTGCYWGLTAELPVLSRIVPPGVPGITLQTPLKNGVVISDVPGPTGGILIQTTTGAMISVSDTGIIISNGKGAIINMTGPVTDINLGALTIT